MKKLFLLLSITSISAFACPNFNGVYTCSNMPQPIGIVQELDDQGEFLIFDGTFDVEKRYLDSEVYEIEGGTYIASCEESSITIDFDIDGIQATTKITETEYGVDISIKQDDVPILNERCINHNKRRK